jgi:hypothetical protein
MQTQSRMTAGFKGLAIWPRWVLAAAAALLALPSLLRADDYDRWYAVTMTGQQAGWMHTTQKTAGDLITTTSAMSFSLGRGNAAVTITMDGAFIETAAGKPVSLKSVTP